MKRATVALVMTVAMLAVLTVGCTRVDLREEADSTSERVTAKGAERAEAEIHMGPGDLTVTGGAKALMEGDFSYSDGRLAPEIDYRIDGDVGELDMRQDADGNWFPGFWGSGYRNVWDVAFADDMPLDLRMQLGAGDVNVELGETMLEEFVMETGAGSLDIDLTGSDTLDEVRVSTGAGDIRLDASEGSSLRDFHFETGAGSLKLDLSGDAWTEDMEGRVDAGAGDVTIKLPQDVPVEVSVDKGIGDVQADGLLSDGDVWVNDAHGGAGPLIEIRVTQGVGSVRLEVE
jgi:hypothetical protein